LVKIEGYNGGENPPLYPSILLPAWPELFDLHCTIKEKKLQKEQNFQVAIREVTVKL
jgi:hypothetical protein